MARKDWNINFKKHPRIWQNAPNNAISR